MRYTCVTHVFTTADDPNSRPDNTTQCTALQTTQCAVQQAKGALHVGPVDGLDRQVADRIPQDLQPQFMTYKVQLRRSYLHLTNVKCPPPTFTFS